MKKNFHIIVISVIFSIILWVSISLSNDYYTTIKIPLKIVNFPPGYTTGTDIPNYISVKLKGQGWKLISFYIARESDYIISAGKEKGKKVINLNNYLSDNKWLSSDVDVIDITPDTVSFDLEKIVSKKVPIIPNLNLKFKDGYGLATPIRVYPESTVVYGPIDKIRKMHAASTVDEKLGNLDQKMEKNVLLADIPNVTYEKSYVTVGLDIEKIVEKSFDGIPVKVNDVPNDRQVLLLPNQISIGLRGGVDVLAKLAGFQFNAHVTYRNVILDTLGSVRPKIIIPENTDLIYTKPERLKYIIKKF